MRKTQLKYNIFLLVFSGFSLIVLWKFLFQEESAIVLSSVLSPSGVKHQRESGNNLKDKIVSYKRNDHSLAEEVHEPRYNGPEQEYDNIPEEATSYLTADDLFDHYSAAASQVINLQQSDQQKENPRESLSATINFSSKNCQMENCFDFTRCQNGFKVYVYSPDKFVPISTTYEKILNRIMSSPYYTNDATEACLFVLSIDTLDRDALSHDFVRNLGTRLQNLQYWNNGENHIIFNLYAGTWPDYNETELGFDVGKAILAKASMSFDQFRPNFDISLPLFHPSHPEKGDDLGTAIFNEFPALKKHLIAFKGKRYVYGIGSDTRNSIYHLHNGNDIIMVTTCKHGKNWKEMKDDRCDEDNKEYEKYDYETLLQNSTFCLVPRGRRLGSFRFLEALKAGCIPVLLSNGWVLPFSEVIDWNAASISADERTLLQTLEVVRSVSTERIFQMKQQTQVVWNQYLSSVERIVESVFEIMRDRIKPQTCRDSSIWNTAPGALSIDTSYGDDLEDFPFYHFGNSTFLKSNFTAVVHVQAAISGAKSLSSYSNSPLFRLIKNLGKSSVISKIIVVWNSNRAIPRVWPDVPVPFSVKQTTASSVSQRFFVDEIETDAVFSIDEDMVLTSDEFDFAYRTWRAFPDRIVGYQSRSHYWSDPKEQWRYSSKLTNDYSMILNGAAIYHVYYNHLYWTKIPPAALMTIESLQNCEDIAFNILISRITRKSPIKLTFKKSTKEFNGRSTSWVEQERLKQRHDCLNELHDIYGSMPLKRSNIRMDPILFRDPVSNLRKKYRQLENAS